MIHTAKEHISKSVIRVYRQHDTFEQARLVLARPKPDIFIYVCAGKEQIEVRSIFITHSLPRHENTWCIYGVVSRIKEEGSSYGTPSPHPLWHLPFRTATCPPSRGRHQLPRPSRRLGSVIIVAGTSRSRIAMVCSRFFGTLSSSPHSAFRLPFSSQMILAQRLSSLSSALSSAGRRPSTPINLPFPNRSPAKTPSRI
ncbi:hypothetical protein BV20DRAFT_731804 [Pilatotrama ljubarskyi]|nr:hypothetical protein BV20DRAFT_731804 [Pilatotrama ljubarskyi]